MERIERDRLLLRLRADAERIAGRFGLTFRAIRAEHPRVKSRYGVCFADGLIKIRLNHAKTGRPLKYSSLIDTLCHELAHLRHFDHGPEFQRFFWQLLRWARREGIYRPATRRSESNADPVAPPPSEPLSQRNGVAVFGGDAAGQQTRWTDLLTRAIAGDADEPAETGSPPARAGRTRRPRGRGRGEDEQPAPRQLSLFG